MTKKTADKLFKGLITVIPILVLSAFVLFWFGSNPFFDNRWYKILFVKTGSMSPTINPGDLIVIRPPSSEPKPGTIVTLSTNPYIVTHRLVKITNGKIVTKGDANKEEDDWQGVDVKIIGVYWFKIPKIGWLFAKTDPQETHAFFKERVRFNFEISSAVENVPSVSPTDTDADKTTTPAPTDTPDGETPKVTPVPPTQTPTPQDNYVPPEPEPTTTPDQDYPMPNTPAPEPDFNPYPDPKN